MGGYGELLKTVTRNHGELISNNAQITTGELLAKLEDIYQELAGMDEDEDVDCDSDISFDAADYLSEWTELAWASERLGNVEEDIQTLEELIELVGEDHKLNIDPLLLIWVDPKGNVMGKKLKV